MPLASVLLAADRSSSGVRVDEAPSIVVRDGAVGRFVSGRDVPVVLGLDEDGRQDVEYRSTGTILRVRPWSRPDGLVSVDVEIEVSALDGVGVVDNPVIATRSVETSAVVRRGEALVLSGFRASRDGSSRARGLGLGRSRSSEREAMAIVLEVSR